MTSVMTRLNCSFLSFTCTNTPAHFLVILLVSSSRQVFHYLFLLTILYIHLSVLLLWNYLLHWLLLRILCLCYYWLIKKGKCLYSAVSKPQDCSKRFTLYLTVQSDTISTFLGSIQPYATINARRLLLRISTTVCSQVLTVYLFIF